MKKCCRNCALWDIETARGPSGRVRPDTAVRCNWKLTEPLPQSVTLYGMQVAAGWTRLHDGADCKCFIKRKEG